VRVLSRITERARDTHDRASLSAPRLAADLPPLSDARAEIKRRAATKLSQRDGDWPQCAVVLAGSLRRVELVCKGADLQERRQRQTVRGDLCGGGLDATWKQGTSQHRNGALLSIQGYR